MQYDFFFDGQPFDREDIPIGHVHRESWQRPVLHSEVKIKGKVVRVVRIVPEDNPDDAPVTYYVEPLNNNWPYRADK